MPESDFTPKISNPVLSAFKTRPGGVSIADPFVRPLKKFFLSAGLAVKKSL